ncbi:Rieske 2Fe-2S domain-containing protein [Naumannella halotolerans]|uniref:Cytochrome bc1 complex Rieske iron-sulfur subunit n=1 Tax=Naumannella halotolerans TaxID=993414 RepID=A0A4R7J6D2_9ACTN|nr:ubiquinol-cytochrome c reductase iron-sulfur subunit [Naumannella halotolerans]
MSEHNDHDEPVVEGRVEEGSTAVVSKPIPDPGLEAEAPRYSDVNEAAAKRYTRMVAGLFLLAPLFAIAYVVVYFAIPVDYQIVVSDTQKYPAQNVFLGLTLGLALLAIGVGAVQWGREIMGDHEEAEERHAAASSEDERAEFMAKVDKGIEQANVGRRKVILGSMGVGVGALGLPLIISLGDLGPWPTGKWLDEHYMKTIWAPGVRLVNDVTFTPIRAADLTIGQLVNAEPETLQELDGHDTLVEKSKSAIIIVRMNPNQITIPATRQDWHVNGILCYSKICTHVGCPISLWEQQTHHLLCPCHQSTFDLGNSGVVVFGPASRALPQLPITVDAEGYLVARSGFVDDLGNPLAPGPSYFERDSSTDLTRPRSVEELSEQVGEN